MDNECRRAFNRNSKVKSVNISPVVRSDIKSLTKRRYFFDWKKEFSTELYKLTLKEQNDILGIISLERIPTEWRVHIRLLTVSSENKGSGKIYEGIAGNLLAHAAKIAVNEYGEMACISLRPKSSIVLHYISKYNMNITGTTLSLEVPEILDLINKYEKD